MTNMLPLLPRASRLFFLATLVACLSSPTQAKRKDMVIMNNGDHFTGEVKRLQNGLLYLEIMCPTASRWIGIEKRTGDTAKNQDFLIREATKEVIVPSADVVSIETKKSTFWRQLQGSVDFGYSFTSGNSQNTLNVDTSTAYKTRHPNGKLRPRSIQHLVVNPEPPKQIGKTCRQPLQSF
jgi:hypothetical protein